jgi:hypothetical protein
MNKSEQLLDLARQAHRRATEEPSLRRGVEERRLARYFEQLAEAQAWLDKRHASTWNGGLDRPVSGP